MYTLHHGKVPKLQFLQDFSEDQKKLLHFTHLNIQASELMQAMLQDPLERTHLVTGTLSSEAIGAIRRAMTYGLAKLKKRKDFLGLLNIDNEGNALGLELTSSDDFTFR